MPKLKNMTTPGYNGLSCQFIPTKSPNRVGVKLSNGKKIAVRFECVECEQDPPLCSVCLKPCFPFTTETLSCGHEFHRECMKQWRGTAGYDVEADGARCPECRAYVGLSNENFMEQHAECMIFQALGAICQVVARLDGKPEPSETEELNVVFTQYNTLMSQAPEAIEKLEAFRKHYLRAKTKVICGRFLTQLKNILCICCVPADGDGDDSNVSRAIESWLWSWTE